MVEPIQTETHQYTLESVIKEAVRAAMAEHRGMIPATVISYDHTTGTCSARPDMKRNYNGTVVEMPIIYNIPVEHPQSGEAFIHMPLKPGHKVKLTFADRSLEKWLSNGLANDPDDSRMHHISDAMAYPGGYPLSEKRKVSNGDDIIIKNGDGMEARFKPNGHFQIENSVHEFMSKLAQIMDDLSEAKIYTCNGPQSLFHFSLRQDMRDLKTFKEG